MDLNRILILQTKRIGDLVLTAPLVAALRQQLPESELTLLAQGAASRLAPLVRGVNRCLSLQPRRLDPWPWLELWSREFDAAIDLSATDRSRFALEICGAPIRIGFEKWQRRRWLGGGPLYNHPVAGSIGRRHITEFFLTTLPELGLEIPGQLPQTALKVPQASPVLAEQLRQWRSRGRLAVVHPGTTEPGKFWRPEAWARTIEHLVERHGCQVILSQGRGGMEDHHLAAIRRQLRVPLALDESCSLQDLVVWLDQSVIAVGVDTGAMHIAALAGMKQVVLFTPKHAVQWATRQPNARILVPQQGSDVVGIPLAKVTDAIDDLLSTGPGPGPDRRQPATSAAIPGASRRP